MGEEISLLKTFLPLIRGWKEWDWHRSLSSISHCWVQEDTVCVTVGTGWEGWLCPLLQTQEWHLGLTSATPRWHLDLSSPQGGSWTELWLWAPMCRICRDALPGKLVSCQSENIPEEEVSIRNPIHSCTQKMLYGNNETVHGTSRFLHFIGPWCWFKPIRLGRLPLNTFLQSISKILFCCHRNENHDNTEANLYLHFSSCLPANAKGLHTWCHADVTPHLHVNIWHCTHANQDQNRDILLKTQRQKCNQKIW